MVEASVPALCGQDGLDLLLQLLVGEAVGVGAVVAAVRRKRVLVDVRAPDRRQVLDVHGTGVVVLRGHGIDVVGAAAVMGYVREVLVDHGFVACVECERRRAGGVDGLRQDVRRRSQLACVRHDTEERRASWARCGAARGRDGERQPGEHENLGQACRHSAQTSN